MSFYFILFVGMFCLQACLCIMYVPGAHKVWNRALHSTGLELEMLLNHNVGSENWAWVPWKNRHATSRNIFMYVHMTGKWGILQRSNDLRKGVLYFHSTRDIWTNCLAIITLHVFLSVCFLFHGEVSVPYISLYFIHA